MKRMFILIFVAVLLFSLAACGNNEGTFSDQTINNNLSQSEGVDNSQVQQIHTNILIAYDPEPETVTRAAKLLADTLNADLIEITNDSNLQVDTYEFVLLGFDGHNQQLSPQVQNFLNRHDFGARTIYPFVLGDGIDLSAVSSAISELEPGALMGNGKFLIEENTTDEEIREWGTELELSDSKTAVPTAEEGNTVATATVTPDQQQVLYLWEEDNVPAQTEYTMNDGRYSDNPDFRPYLTSYPLPKGMDIKGAVLISPGGAFQFRSNQLEGVDVAEALNILGYQCFVVDYRLQPYTQQEGALDLARAVRFVRSHAEEYGIEPQDIAVMGFSAGGILSGEMLINFDGDVLPTVLDPEYQPDELDSVSADVAACGMIYSFYGQLSLGTTDVDLLRSGDLPPTFYCYGTRDPFYGQFLANADAAEQAGVLVERLRLDNMPHGFGAGGDWIPAYDEWLTEIFSQ